HNIPISEIIAEFYQNNVHHDLSCMNIECSHCGTLHWLDEYVVASSKIKPKFRTCYNHRKVILLSLLDPPSYLRHLFENNDDQCKEFHSNIYQYNAAHAFTSLGVKIDQTVFSDQNIETSYMQLYIYDPDIAHQIRIGQNRNLDTQLIETTPETDIA
ncbi:16414_t:CDS:2, partial [Racocetra persica]